MNNGEELSSIDFGAVAWYHELLKYALLGKMGGNPFGSERASAGQQIDD